MISVDNNTVSIQWWESRRKKYNLGLVIAGFAAFILYAVLGILLIAPYDRDFEITLFTIIFQATGYMFFILIANLFYNLGAVVDKQFNAVNNEAFRGRIYNLGFWFSVAIPFIVPLFIVIEYFARYAGKG